MVTDIRAQPQELVLTAAGRIEHCRLKPLRD
jgi:hypothetical protein